MEINVNEYIDFNSLFNKLYEYHEDYYSQHAYESSDGARLYGFASGQKQDFKLEVLECEFTDKEIMFVFIHDLNNATESDLQGESEAYIITYDRIKDEFSSCVYEGC
jgi:hypothetical protein